MQWLNREYFLEDALVAVVQRVWKMNEGEVEQDMGKVGPEVHAGEDMEGEEM